MVRERAGEGPPLEVSTKSGWRIGVGRNLAAWMRSGSVGGTEVW